MFIALRLPKHAPPPAATSPFTQPDLEDIITSDGTWGRGHVSVGMLPMMWWDTSVAESPFRAVWFSSPPQADALLPHSMLYHLNEWVCMPTHAGNK